MPKPRQPRKRTPVLSNAVAWLQEHVRDCTVQKRARLSSIPALALRCGVSVVTMWRAVRVLADKGLLVVNRGKGVSVAGAMTGASGSTGNTACYWMNVVQRIERDIMARSFGRDDSLPSIKELSVTYDANYRTIRKALDELARRMVIARGTHRPSTFHVARPKSRGRFVYLFINRGRAELSSGYYLDPNLRRNIENLFEIEDLFRPARVAVKLVQYHRSGDRTRYTDFPSGCEMKPSGAGDLAGCVLVVLNADDVDSETCSRLVSLKCPVGVLDVSGELRFPRFFFDNPLVKFFSNPDLSLPGQIMGRYLWKAGHRRVAYLSAFHDRPWSQARLAGIRKVWGTGGASPEDVKSYVLGAPVGLLQRGDGVSAARDVADHLIHAFKPFGGSSRSSLRTAVIAASLPPLMSLIGQIDLYGAIYPLAKRAHADHRVTAWIFSSDREAMAGLAYLEREHVAVPKQISVVGFDNSPNALKRGLTSYHDNLNAMANALANYILRPAVLGSNLRSKVIDFSGFVVERDSTRRMVPEHRALPVKSVPREWRVER